MADKWYDNIGQFFSGLISGNNSSSQTEQPAQQPAPQSTPEPDYDAEWASFSSGQNNNAQPQNNTSSYDWYDPTKAYGRVSNGNGGYTGEYTYSHSARDLQAQLNKLGANIAVDGYYGPETAAAVAKYLNGSSFPSGGASTTATGTTAATSALSPTVPVDASGAQALADAARTKPLDNPVVGSSGRTYDTQGLAASKSSGHNQNPSESAVPPYNVDVNGNVEFRTAPANGGTATPARTPSMSLSDSVKARNLFNRVIDPNDSFSAADFTAAMGVPFEDYAAQPHGVAGAIQIADDWQSRFAENQAANWAKQVQDGYMPKQEFGELTGVDYDLYSRFGNLKDAARNYNPGVPDASPLSPDEQKRIEDEYNARFFAEHNPERNDAANSEALWNDLLGGPAPKNYGYYYDGRSGNISSPSAERISTPIQGSVNVVPPNPYRDQTSYGYDYSPYSPYVSGQPRIPAEDSTLRYYPNQADYFMESHTFMPGETNEHVFNRWVQEDVRRYNGNLEQAYLEAAQSNDPMAEQYRVWLGTNLYRAGARG